MKENVFQENWSGSITSTGHQGAGSQRFIQTHIFIRVNSGKAVIPIQVGRLIRTHTGSPEATRRQLWRPAGDVDQRAWTHERSLHGLRRPFARRITAQQPNPPPHAPPPQRALSSLILRSSNLINCLLIY